MIFAFMKQPPAGILSCGAYNGYVGWSDDEGSLLESYQSSIEDTDDVLDNLITVHGGITFDQRNVPYDKFPPEVELTPCPSSFAGCRIIGFDVCHFDDGPHHDEEWCKNETLNLKKQVEELLKNGCKTKTEQIARQMLEAILYDNDMVNREEPLDEAKLKPWTDKTAKALETPVSELGEDFFTEEWIDSFCCGDSTFIENEIKEHHCLGDLSDLLNEFFEEY